MTTDLARQDDTAALAVADREQAAAGLTHYLGTGDLSKLTGEQRAALYRRTCDSLGINSLTRPFEWVEFYDPETKGKKLTLYPRAACADQLAYQHRIRVEVVEEKIVGSLFKVVVKGTMPNGRTETNVSYLDLTDRDGNQLRGQKLGNAFMKGHTKAKRRLIFGMVGMMAPPDVEDLQQAKVVYVDGRGNVLENPTREQKALAADPTMARAIGEPVFEDVPLSAAPIPDGPDQRPRAEDLEPPKRPDGPRPDLKSDVDRWCGAWFAAVKGTSLESDEARHEYMSMYSDGRTSSLREFFQGCTPDQAGAFLAHVRGQVDVERAGTPTPPTPPQATQERSPGRSYEDLFPDDDDQQQQPAPAEQPAARPVQMTQAGHDAAVLTGAPAPAGPDRLADDTTYTRRQLLDLYEAWGRYMQRLDTFWTPDDVKRLPDAALRQKVSDLIAQADDLEEFLRRTDDDDDAAGSQD